MYKKQIKTILICLGLIIFMTGCNYLPSIKEKTKAQSIATTTPVEMPDENSNIPESNTSLTISEKLQAQNKINKFSNLAELQNFVEAIGSAAAYDYSGKGKYLTNSINDLARDGSEKSNSSFTGLEKAESAPGSLGNTPAKDQANQNYSKTNNQVEGVDEADIIKTDGEYIYAVSRNNLFIIKATPPENAVIISKIEFKSRPEEIYINGNSLVVYGPDDKFLQSDVYNRFRRQNNFVFFKVFDISDKKNPRQTRDLQFEGAVSESRMIGDYVYLVTANYQYYILDNEPLLPRILENGQVLDEKCATGPKCFRPDVYYFDIPYSSYNYTGITAVNVVKNAEPINGDIYLMSGSQNLYVSQKSIYITYTKYVSEYELEMEVMKEIVYPRLSDSDRKRIDKIETADNFILNTEEKKNKIQQVIERFGASLTPEEQSQLEKEVQDKLKQKYQDVAKELEKTVIHKIAISGRELDYKTFGEVTGQVLNQFSMDDSGEYFRIATTKSTAWSKYETAQQASYNSLYVLDENLKVVGSLENLAVGERIYSVRFMGERAYLVTFKQTDPLFVVDLTDPKAPKVLGELKIPGFSNYLHPYDNNTIIGIGKETKENQWGGITTGGIKLSLFDVTDVSNPNEIDNYIIGNAGSDSIALRDHKAFLFSKDKNLLVIPATVNNANAYGSSKLMFSGAMVFNVDKTGFKLKGQIDHSNGGLPAESDFWWGYNYYDNNVLRSLYVNDSLYTFSNNYVKINILSDLKEVKNLELKKAKSEDFEIVN